MPMIDGKDFGVAGFKYLGTPYSEMDCQAFVERCMRDCGLVKDLAGSNAWYREIMNHGWVGTPEECVDILGTVPVGALLFILEHDGGEPEKYKPDGIGNASHIGIVTGQGEGAIHSSASRGCVAESKFKNKTIKNGGWNRVGLYDQISYDYSPEPSPSPTPEPEPKPTETAIVGNVPSEKKQKVNFRKRPNKNAALIDRIPCGELVEVLEHGAEWSKIKWHGYTGYMMTEFLIFEEEPPEELYCVTIHDLPLDLAEEIANIYGGSITTERG